FFFVSLAAARERLIFFRLWIFCPWNSFGPSSRAESFFSRAPREAFSPFHPEFPSALGFSRTVSVPRASREGSRFEPWLETSLLPLRTDSDPSRGEVPPPDRYRRR